MRSGRDPTRPPRTRHMSPDMVPLCAAVDTALRRRDDGEMGFEAAVREAESLLRNPFEARPDRAGDAAIAEVAERPTPALDELRHRSMLKEARRLAVAVAC